MLNQLEELKKENKRLKKFANLSNTKQGIHFNGEFLLTQDARVINDESVLLILSNRDSFFLKTKDSRKPNENGQKYSNISMLFLKKENIEMVQYLKAGDVIDVEGLLVSFQEKFDKTNETREKLLSKGLNEAQVQYVIDNMPENTLTGFRTETKFYGISMFPLKVSDETMAVYKENKEAYKQQLEEARKEMENQRVEIKEENSKAPENPFSANSNPFENHLNNNQNNPIPTVKEDNPSSSAPTNVTQQNDVKEEPQSNGDGELINTQNGELIVKDFNSSTFDWGK